MKITNIFRNIPESFTDEITDVLYSDKTARIERILSRGHKSPEGFWYDQEEDEWVLLIRGKAVLDFLDPEETVGLIPGDSLLIPAHRKHRIVSTDPEETSVWLTVFNRRNDNGKK